MLKQDVLQKIVGPGLVAVIRASSADAAARVAEACVEGGIQALEVTFTVPNAAAAIADLTKRHQTSKVAIGAGTVLDPETARACHLAGAQFFVTPSLNLRTIEMAHRYSRPIFPGGLTPTEILTAWEAGADGVKVFPCNALGGAKYIKSLKAPLPHVDLIPTGGVNLETIADFLTAGSTAVGVGSELVDAASVKSGNYQAVTERSRKFREIVASVRGSTTS